MNVLFVCRQNIGRSQLAAALFNKYAPSSHADSAGTIVALENQTLQDYGAQYIIQILANEGIDARKFVSRQLKPEHLNGRDKVIVMAERETIPDWLWDTTEFEYWEIADPKFANLKRSRQIFEVIKDKVVALASK